MQLTREDAYAFRRVLSKLDVPADLNLSPVAKLLLETLNPQENPAGWQTLQEMVTKDHQIMQQVMYVDPKAEPPQASTDCGELYVPQLPKAAQLDDKLVEAANGVGYFHRDCTNWLKQKSPMTPHIFLESAPLWAAGLAIARRAVLRLSFDDIYPNLYILWVAPTTYYHKSTGLKAITRLVRSTLQQLLLPETTTPEMLMAKLAGQKPANYDQLLPSEKKLEDLGTRFAGQRGMSIDEASKILIPKKYMEGHAEALMQLFDSADRMERELRGDGKLIVYNPSLSLIGATTPTMLARYMTDSEWESGLMARFMLLTPTEKDMKYVVSDATPEITQKMEGLKSRLLRIHNAFPAPPEWEALYDSDDPVRLPNIETSMESEVMTRFHTYSEAMHTLTDPRQGLDERLRGNYGRFPVLTMKLSLILTLMDWVEDGAKGTPRISLAHWARAQMLTEEYRTSAHHLLAEINVSQDVRNEQKILDFIVRAQKDKPPTKREIHRGTGIKNRKDAYAAVDALIESGVLESVDRKSSRGRGATAYVVTEE
ncbi:MAG: DUF3987 domain-containing protein [Anaerolineae bacterium]|nr:DUF3987 domain-containing protein [Anaerolineae bacterium]